MAWIDKWLKIAGHQGASDLHVCSGQKPLMRWNGDLVAVEGLASVIDPVELHQHLKEIAPPDKWKEFETSRDTDFAYNLEDCGRFRCNFFVDQNGPCAVFRLVPDKIPTIQGLGMPPAVADLCNLKKGLVLVTGPSGSGKSTTLAAMINRINETRAAHIITIEDPIEFIYPQKKSLVNQREVYHHTRGFESALRAALREDPEIVLVGELRDLETVRIALQTAETGHLVFGTLHTNTASSAVNRLIEIFPFEMQNQIRSSIAYSLKAVVAQSLVKLKGGGRAAAYEVLIVTPSVSVNIRESKNMMIASAMQVGKAHGMCVLDDSLIEYVQQGRVDAMEAFLHSIDRKEFRARLEALGIELDLSKQKE